MRKDSDKKIIEAYKTMVDAAQSANEALLKVIEIQDLTIQRLHTTQTVALGIVNGAKEDV